MISRLTHIEATADKYKNCYFWKAQMKAYDRRSKEFSKSYDFTILGNKYTVEFDLSISCKNFYFTKNIYFNGNKTTMTKIKNLKKKLVAIVEARELKKASRVDISTEVA